MTQSLTIETIQTAIKITNNKKEGRAKDTREWLSYLNKILKKLRKGSKLTLGEIQKTRSIFTSLKLNKKPPT
ncbi:MAG: hypothetical protein OXR68_02060 [Alphaproteobacteria bacterium]|nr:hypothetical protein [Alphaproteobacteria bacterium]